MVTRKNTFLIFSVKFLFVFFLLPVHGQNTVLESGIDKLTLAGCSTQAGKIVISGTGNIQSNKAYFPSETTLEEIDIIFHVSIDEFSSGNIRFGIGKQASLAGTLVEFSGNSMESKILVNRLNGSSSILVHEFILPFNLSEGVLYQIKVSKRIRDIIIEIESTTGYYLSEPLTYPSPFFGLLWGTPFIGCHTGVISVNDFILTTPFSRTLRLAAWGDSFIEGSSLDNPEDRYISLVKDAIGYSNISIMGRGGEGSGSFNSRFPKELEWFRDTRYALIAIGVNDGSFTSWKSNMQKHIDSLKKYNIIPIIATLTPRADRLPFIAQANNWIRNTYDGAYIDLGKVVSPNDENWYPGSGMADSVHPTPSGHLVMFERIKLEAPYIFREVRPFSIDYINESTFEDVGDTLEYAITTSFLQSFSGSNTTISVVPGSTIYFRENASYSYNHLFDILNIPQRPMPPTNSVVDGSAATFDWTNNPDYSNISDYEYSIDNGTTWLTCTQKPINSLANSLRLRIKASLVNFKSEELYFENVTNVSLPAVSFINVYPNPIQDKLMIDNITEETRLTIYSSDGYLVKTVLLTNVSNEIDVEGLKAGLYILNLHNDRLKKNLKIVKN